MSDKEMFNKGNYFYKESRGMDITGMRSGKLVAIRPVSKQDSKVVWECKCDCGNLIEVPGTYIKNQRIKSCGCTSHRKDLDLTGKRIGMLTVLSKSIKRNTRYAIWECKCDCGKVVDVYGSDLRQGKRLSCGCVPPRSVKFETCEDFVGQTVGRLTVTSILNPQKKLLQCECSCGRGVVASFDDLKNRTVTACSVCSNHRHAEPGNKFGMLTVIKDTGLRDPQGYSIWECRCECGNICRKSTYQLHNNVNPNCGCNSHNWVEKQYKNIMDNITNPESIAANGGHNLGADIDRQGSYTSEEVEVKRTTSEAYDNTDFFTKGDLESILTDREKDAIEDLLTILDI